MKKVLVTGGAGFIGSHICAKLQKENLEVIALDNLSNGNRNNLPADIPLYHTDILNYSNTESVIAKERPDYIIHQAAQVSVQSSLQNPTHDAKINTIGTLHVLQLSVKYKVKKFIFASTAAVYGQPHYLPVDEEHHVQPMSFYGRFLF